MPKVIKIKIPLINRHKTKKINLTINIISQVIHNCKTSATIKQAEQLKPL